MANNVQIDITANDNASASISKITGELSMLGKMAGAAFVAAAGATITFVGASIMAAARVDELAVVNQVLAKNAGLSSQSVIDAAAAVKGMGIEAAVAQQTVAQFVRSNLDLTKSAQLARVAQDAAVISGMNSTDALNQMINGIITLQPEMVRTAGITVLFNQAEKDMADSLGIAVTELTVAQKQQAALNAVLEAGRHVTGAYEAAMTTASKQIRSWPRLVNDLMVVIGKPFQETFNQAASAVTSFLKEAIPLFEKLQGMNFVQLTDAFEKWSKSIDWGKISSGLAAGINSIPWAKIGADFKTGLDHIFNGLDQAINNIKWGELAGSVGSGMMNLMAGFSGQGNWDNVKATWANNARQFGEIIKREGEKLKSYMPHLAVTIAFPALGVFIAAADIIKQGMALIADAQSGVFKGSGNIPGGGVTNAPKKAPVVNYKPVNGRAAGGPVSKDQSYWVGENGPEPFIPKSNGTIIPNGGLGMTVNLTFAPAMYTGDANKFINDITPMLNNWYRKRLQS